MESISFWHIIAISSSCSHTLRKFLTISCLVRLCRCRRFFLTMAQRFSIGFRSGEAAGHEINEMPISWKWALELRLTWHGALSCWNKYTPSACHSANFWTTLRLIIWTYFNKIMPHATSAAVQRPISRKWAFQWFRGRRLHLTWIQLRISGPLSWSVYDIYKAAPIRIL